MQPADYAYLSKLEEGYWWFAGMRDITAALLDAVCVRARERLVLDAGCGTGGMMSWLSRYAGNGVVAGVDLEPVALEFCRKRGHRTLAQASVTALPFPDSMFDLLTSFDVLVQLPDDTSDELAMREMLRVLRPGGIAFVRVAAYEWMKSNHDLALGTQHRYATDELVGKMKRAGFEVLRSTHANSLLLPVALFRRLILKRIGLASQGSDVKPLPAIFQWLNHPMTAALRAEAKYLKRLQAKLGFGLSAICVAQRPLRVDSANSQHARATARTSSTLS